MLKLLIGTENEKLLLCVPLCARMKPETVMVRAVNFK